MTFQLPVNEPAERAVIGALLQGTPLDAAPLTPGHFHLADNRTTFEVIQELSMSGLPHDARAAFAALTAKGLIEQAGGDPHTRLQDASAGESGQRYFFDILERARQAREIIQFANAHLPEVSSQLMPAAEFVEKLVNLSAPQAAQGYFSSSDIVAQIEAERTAGTREVFAFGLSELDEHLHGGIQPGELFTIAGGTGRGKTALMVQAAGIAAQAGTPVLYITIEMNESETWSRCVSAATEAPQTAKDFPRRQADAEGWPLFVKGDTADIADIVAAIRHAVRKHKVRLACVDYLQILDADAGDNREQKIGEITRTLKALASSEKIAILTASQVNDAGQLHSCRAIGHHSNAVLSITETGIHCAKFRRGPSQWLVSAALNGGISRFVEIQD